MKFSKPITVIGAVVIALLFATPGVAQAQETRNNADIVVTDSDQFGNTGPLRRGYYDRPSDKGFGADKLLNKHNIDNTNLFKAVLQDPNGRKKDSTRSDTNWEYNAPVGIMLCTDTIVDVMPFQNKKCSKETEDENIRLVMEYRPRDDFYTEDQTFGVITMFCTSTGDERCPPWVNKLVAYPDKGKWPYSLG